MVFTLLIRELGFVTQHEGNNSTRSSIAQWDTEVTTGSKTANLRITDPFSTSQELPVPDPEQSIAWHLEKHVSEPFETSKAETAVQLLSSYGRNLASQLAATGLLPGSGHLQIRVLTPTRGEKHAESPGPSLQHLHWEVLEDVSIWPVGFRFSGVTVVRSVTGTKTGSGAKQGDGRSGVFNILLVVSRPRPDKDVDYQLVAKSLVAIVDHVSKASPSTTVSLKMLRPPTWQAFREHLQDAHYDLVHFDMKGEIQTGPDGDVNAVLEFCRPDLDDPLKMRRDLKTAEEVGKVLAVAGVRTVVLNACNSASFRDSAPGSNLAEVLLGHGVQSVLAMAYKVVEEAVEIFMAAFYQSLLERQASVQDAAWVARSALLANKFRRARYMHNVRLSDYIVPVLYTSDDAQPTSSAFSILSSIGKILASIKDITQTLWAGQRPEASQVRRVLGRDYNILSLETLLSVSRVVLVHGQAGVGKTELLRYVCEWWKLSGWITAWVYIDLAPRPWRRRYYSMADVVEAIGEQLGIEKPQRSPDAVLTKLRSGKYLVVFDSVDAFEAPISIDRVSWSDAKREQLGAFIEAASHASMVIVASRFSTTPITPGLPDRYKYHLPGLSVLDSVCLLQELAFGEQKPPETFCQRESIDSLRRAVIILEGNPEAMQLIVPELRKAEYNGEALLNALLYGVCELQLPDNPTARSRFAQTITCAVVLPSFVDFDKTLITIEQLAPFWNIVPKDLNMYYWFIYLWIFKLEEGSFSEWQTDDFRDLVHNADMGRRLRTYWPEIETKLVKAGILSYATITKKNGDKLSCYHIHPIFTLIARTLLTERSWAHARFAYVRQALLWDPDIYEPGGSMDWISATWDDSGPQHYDHVHNWRATALAWALQDGNPLDEVDRKGGNSVFDLAYRLVIGTTWTNPRQARLLVPHIQTYLLQAHMIVDLFRPNGMPTLTDLEAILSYSWTLWRLETFVISSQTTTTRAAVVTSALNTLARWQSHHMQSSPNSNPTTVQMVLPDRLEVYHTQLLFAHATTAADAGDLTLAKSLYETHLSHNPSTTDKTMQGYIRSWLVQSLYGWAGCVFQLALRHSNNWKLRDRFDGKEIQRRLKEAMGQLSEMFGGHHSAGGKMLRKPGRMMEGWCRIIREQGLTPGLAKLRVRDQVGFALELEPEAEKRFGVLAREALDMPLSGVFEDVFEEEVQSRLGQDENGGGEGRKEELVWECAMDRMAETRGLEAEGMRSWLREFESGLRMLAGDTKGAADAVQAEIAREALSSTTSRGWQRLAELHRFMYMLAVERAEQPDYKKGLTHLREWLRLHQGFEMRHVSKRDQCHVWLKFARCYHELGQLADAARSVIKVVQIGQTLTPADGIDGDVSKAHTFLYDQLAKFKKLDIFLDSKVVFSTSPDVADLNLKERVMMYQIMTKTREVEQEKIQLENRVKQAREKLRKGRESVAGFDPEDLDERARELIAKADKALAEPEPKELDLWLF